MDIYQYIATNNTNLAASLCDKYGYSYNTIDDVANCLRDMVSNGGDSSLREVSQIHPDRELLVTFATVKPNGACGDGCDGNFYKNIQKAKIGYAVNGSASSMSPLTVSHISSQTGFLIVGAALLISAAIIAKS